MKQFIAAAAMAALAFGEASQECLYCRKNDMKAGFLVSFSYCKQSNTCLQDSWNYLTRPCAGGWKRGRDYELDDCDPDEINCPEFVSSPELFQTYQNYSWNLAAGGKCTVTVDATEGVARVSFLNQNNLGIENIPIDVGDIFTVKTSKVDIIIFNGNEKGPISFDISFSGAELLTAGAASVAALLTYLSF